MNPNDRDTRPDPDRLLARLAAETSREQRGKLKVFFGAAPGVGKTYAMLTAARALQEQGVKVLAGIVETHGRDETAALLAHFDLLPRQRIDYKGRLLEEFDLDAALQRRPQLVLVDELAHTNAPGSRHPKRWQDIRELLATGIDVFTTINVQHIESLNDVVGRITGIRVWERVPDHVIDQADEMVLVDLPPEELLQRLRAGKVYIPQQAERAVEHFFRKGNLLALRELALRRTADRVDGDVRAWRRESSVTTVWPTREAVLVCVGPGPDSEKLVRRAARRANLTGAPWHAIAIETPSVQTLPDAARARILGMLKLAQEMGGQTASLAGTDPVEITIGYAREHNLGTVLVGRDRYRRLPWQHSFAERLGRSAPDLELLQIAREDDPTASTANPTRNRTRKPIRWRTYLLSGVSVALVAAGSSPLLGHFDLANIVMIFLLAVVGIALYLGRGAAVLAAFLSVAAFDFFFVPPRFAFAVSDAQYLVTFAVMLIVALVVGQLTAGLRFQVATARGRERRIQALYTMSRDLSSALTVEQIVDICQRFIKHGFNAAVVVFVPDHNGQLQLAEGSTGSETIDPGIAQWSFEHGQAAGLGTDTLPSAKALYVPIKTPARPCGILAILPQQSVWELPPEQQRLLDTSVTLMATALERIHDNMLVRDAQVGMESERLRNALLAAISHDLRTPLTVITGLADAMQIATPPLTEPHLTLVQALRGEVTRTVAMVNNVLDMARMQLGHIVLNREWQTLEEIVGLAMSHCAPLLAQHEVCIDLPADLPLLHVDTTLMTRVLNNLLENAAKYTPPRSHVTLSARQEGVMVDILLHDNGPGLPPGMEQRVFEKFTRGTMESRVTGFGLGLAIVRSIIEAHGGSVRAENLPGGGACFTLSLPVGTPPPPPPLEP
ncbi:MAG: DUF4118 domain-containing protein [Magnetococcales bacterium]|nr:DUF4118 domain-containing protein [Magnetococcales bacterium]